MPRIRRRSLLWLWLFLVVCLLNQRFANGSNNNNPYQILGISPSSTSQEIQRAYKKMCLKYHPDKNVNKSKQERKKCEDMFKQVQHAYSLIGTSEAKSKFDVFGDASSSSTSNFSARKSAAYSNTSPFGSDPFNQAFFNAFQAGRGGPRFYYYSQQPPPSGPNPFESWAGSFTSATGLSFKSIYIQKTKIPLKDLYTGTHWRFNLVDNLWTRYRAAMRGKVMYMSFYQGLIYSLPFLRKSRFLAFLSWLWIMHATIPKPIPDKIYESTLRPGLKGGGKVKFESTSFMTPEIIFEIQEGPDKLYKRVDNDLHTEITITMEEAKNGCTKTIQAIDDSSNIEISIKPNVLNDGDTMKVLGKGWPIKNAEDVYRHGDLIVLIRIKDDTKKKKRNKRSREKKKMKDK